MFADFLYAANTFKRFTYMDLFERDVLNKKLEKLAECSEVDLEVVEYFEFYFTNLVRFNFFNKPLFLQLRRMSHPGVVFYS